MEARTYQAREIREALALVRRELGPDAVILETRRVPGRALGLLGGTLIEITAAAAESQGNTAATPAVSAPAKAPADLRAIRALLPERRAERARETPKPPVKAMIADDPGIALAAAVGQATLGTVGVAPHATLRRRLLAAMVPRDLCESWLRALPTGLDHDASEGALRSLLRTTLGPSVGLCEPRTRVVAFVGPTGVGKTTSVAKLAASASLVSGQKVALVSLDDGRIGGTAALRAYAKVLDLPITVAPPAGLAAALADHRDAELVLVDTAGLSPAQPEGFAELGRKLARAGEPVHTHLVVAAATRSEELERIAHLYRATEPRSLLVTKIDEAIAIGSVLALRVRAELPFSFAATGPQVPEDLVLAQPDVLLDLLLGGART